MHLFWRSTSGGTRSSVVGSGGRKRSWSSVPCCGCTTALQWSRRALPLKATRRRGTGSLASTLCQEHGWLEGSGAAGPLRKKCSLSLFQARSREHLHRPSRQGRKLKKPKQKGHLHLKRQRRRGTKLKKLKRSTPQTLPPREEAEAQRPFNIPSPVSGTTTPPLPPSDHDMEEGGLPRVCLWGWVEEVLRLPGELLNERVG